MRYVCFCLDMCASTEIEQAEELRYVYQRLGLQCLTETLFDDAGRHLFAGELDPRVLMSYYPDLRGELFLEEDAVDVFAGVAEYLPHEDSIDDISECPPLLPPHPTTCTYSFRAALRPRTLCALSFAVPSSPLPANSLSPLRFACCLQPHPRAARPSGLIQSPQI